MYLPPASNFVEGVDWVFRFIFGISIFFTVLITAVMIFFLLRYNRKRHPKAVQIKDNVWMEITWIVVPTVLVLFMFYYGYAAYKPMVFAPKNAMEVKVFGRMWEWSFVYDGNKEASELVLPVNKPVKLDLIATDVIHGFSIPAFRVKQDAVPGKANFVWFTPQKTGEYVIFCSAYCGVRHSYMGTKVRIVPETEYTAWISNLPEKAAEPAGLTILKKNACTGCHSLDGSKLVSTSFKGLFGKERKVLVNGQEQTITADEAYIHTSIFTPDEQIVAGYSRGIMRSYKGVVTEEEVQQIVQYLQNLK
jgi:cytochrome c oxidase subunit 2